MVENDRLWLPRNVVLKTGWRTFSDITRKNFLCNNDILSSPNTESLSHTTDKASGTVETMFQLKT